MGNLMRPTAAKLRQIHKRQDHPGWLSEYIPAMLATRDEAPSISRPARIYSSKLGRDVHTMSQVESDLLHIGLHYPWMFDLHEQKMLSYMPCSHPLATHPRCQNSQWPGSRGTLKIAEELGALKCHPTIKVSDSELEGMLIQIPFPMIGDFLWYLEDEQGCYCVNWTIKASRSDFQWKRQYDSPISAKMKKTERTAWKASMRHRIEEVYQQDFHIRTVRLTSEDYSKAVALNLEQIHGWATRPSHLTAAEECKILHWLHAAQSSGISPLEMCAELASTERFAQYDVKSVLFRSIWTRQLRVNLFQPILFDFPLLPEEQDIFKLYANWFRR